jgi:DNA invertase Pin-like site-specific DNA recombinase
MSIPQPHSNSPTIYGYARVSSKGQERYGNSLQDQTAQLIAAGCDPQNIYHDSYTGTSIKRPNFSVLLAKLQPGDTLIVTKLDRFARTASDGAALIQSLLQRGITVNILNMGKADNTPMGKLLVTVLLAFAEFERDMIVERTQAGKALAKSTKPNWREGRHPVALSQQDVEYYRRKAQNKELTVQQCCDKLGIARSTWYKLIREGRM